MPSYFSLKIRTNITIIFELGHQSALSPQETSPPKYEKTGFQRRLERILCFFEKLRRPAIKPSPRSYLLLPLLQLLCPIRRRTFSGNRVNPCRRPDRPAPDQSSPQEKPGCKSDLQPGSPVWRKEREQNLSRKPPYINLLYFDLNSSTPNSPQPICIALPCVALG